MFPAGKINRKNKYSGYNNVWLRDNIHIAHAHYYNGYSDIAVKNVKTLANFYVKHIQKIRQIVNGELDYKNPMNRPHIRFNGETLEENPEKWPHAQNDAIGYFLWFISLLCKEEHMNLSADEIALTKLLVKYLEKIEYWQDEDNGHWEETPKTEASSIGAVVAGLKQVQKLAEGKYSENFSEETGFADLLKKLTQKGETALKKILPYECISKDPLKKRDYDSALLFLCFPLNIVSEEMQEKILGNVINNLKGDYGIRRYIGDSFWTADYKEKLKPDKRTSEYSENTKGRDKFHKIGQEAQWCVFDPVISIIYGRKYLQHKEHNDYLQQLHYFNRSVSQITGRDCKQGKFKCPELYYLQKGRYVPNDILPLFWTQANLWMAFDAMKKSIGLNK